MNHRALTLHQPFAQAVVAGAKRFENRSRNFHYRGPLWIHAGQSTEFIKDSTPEHWPESFKLPKSWSHLPFGALVGIVDIIDSLPIAECLEKYGDDEHQNGPYCWVFKNARKLKQPIPIGGQQGIWRTNIEPHPGLFERPPRKKKQLSRFEKLRRRLARIDERRFRIECTRMGIRASIGETRNLVAQWARRLTGRTCRASLDGTITVATHLEALSMPDWMRDLLRVWLKS